MQVLRVGERRLTEDEGHGGTDTERDRQGVG
jgi:hypothetical protein